MYLSKLFLHQPGAHQHWGNINAKRAEPRFGTPIEKRTKYIYVSVTLVSAISGTPHQWDDKARLQTQRNDDGELHVRHC